MIVKHFRLDVIEVNSFVVGCRETNEAMIVDIGEFDPEIDAFIHRKNLDLVKIFITHEHYDHCDGLADAANAYGAETISCTERPGGFKVDTVVKHGDEVRVGNLVGKVVDTSGHTPVGVSLIFPGVIFSGDALFAGSVGGTSTPETYQQQLNNVRNHLFSQPDDFIVHTGHGPSTTIGIERKYNPFFV